jgi:hypothetical protein
LGFWNCYKYGKEAFERKVLLKNIFDKKELIRYEILWIKKKKSHKSCGGYNLTWGGDGNPNPTEETIQKMRDNHPDQSGKKNPMFGRTGENSPWFGKHLPEKHKHKISVALTGKHPTEETRQKLSVATSGEKNPMFGKTGKKSPNFGTHRTKEQKQRMSGENHPRARPVVLISPEGAEYELSCYYPFCREHGLDGRNICAVLQGKRKSHKGWTGKYLEK